MVRFSGQRELSSLALLVFVCGLLACPCRAQNPAVSSTTTDPRGLLLWLPNFQSPKPALSIQSNSAPFLLHDISFTRPPQLSPLYRNVSWDNSAGMIDRMEAAFYCNDTPFIDQVRLPLAALWGGRLKLVWFESDVTTANFVMGLPGGGMLHSMGMYSSGHLAMRTPPSDQLVGMNMVFTLRNPESGSADNSGLHGFQYAVRAGRGFLESVSGR